MNDKLLVFLTVALVAVIGFSVVYSMTWTESAVTMTAGTSSTVAIGLFQDCSTTIPFTAYNWGDVVGGQEYEVTCYVKNNGNQAVYLSFQPGGVAFDDLQTHFRIATNVIEGPATSCQLLPITPTPLPLTDSFVCENGFFLNPGKVVKIDIIMFVDWVSTGGSWSWDFLIAGCAP